MTRTMENLKTLKSTARKKIAAMRFFALIFLASSGISTCFAAVSNIEKPNIIFILTDDFSRDLIPDMLQSPYQGLANMVRAGTTFSNYFVANSLCCPSRTSIFTGKFPHNTGVWTNTFNRLTKQLDGGFGAFQLHQNYKHTFALALKQAGYKTAMLGKYLNGYLPTSSGSTNPSDPQYPEWRNWGWDEWDVADYGYHEFNYDLNQNGVLHHYGSLPQDYLTDVISQLGQDFIRKSASGPFYIELSTFAPHAFYTPAPTREYTLGDTAQNGDRTLTFEYGCDPVGGNIQ